MNNGLEEHVLSSEQYFEESIKEHFAFIGWDVSFLPGGYSKTRVRTLLS